MALGNGQDFFRVLMGVRKRQERERRGLAGAMAGRAVLKEERRNVPGKSYRGLVGSAEFGTQSPE